jgi:hypothetical protein
MSVAINLLNTLFSQLQLYQKDYQGLYSLKLMCLYIEMNTKYAR